MPEIRTATEQTRSQGVSDLFVHHELLITESDLHDWLTIQHLPHYRRLFVERRYFRADKVLQFTHAGQTYRLRPDSGSMIEQTSTNSPPSASLRFKEVDRGTESFGKLVAKFRLWDQWAQSVEGQQYLKDAYAEHGHDFSRPTFKLLVIAHANSRDPADDAKRLVWLFSAALTVSARMRRRIYLTTAAAMQQALQERKHRRIPAAAPIWRRLNDAVAWASEYEALQATSPANQRREQFSYLRQFVAKRLPQTSIYSLFPLE